MGEQIFIFVGQIKTKLINQALVVWKLDKDIYRMNHYPVDKQTRLSIGCWFIWWTALSIFQATQASCTNS